MAWAQGKPWWAIPALVGLVAFFWLTWACIPDAMRGCQIEDDTCLRCAWWVEYFDRTHRLLERGVIQATD